MFMVFAFLSWPFSACLWAWAILKLWDWFVFPSFNIDPPGFVATIGLSMFIQSLTRSLPMIENRDTIENISYAIAEGFLRPLLLVFFGWVVSWFMP